MKIQSLEQYLKPMVDDLKSLGPAPLNQLYDGHFSRVALARSQLDDPSVPALPVLIPEGDIAKNLFHGLLVRPLRQRQSSVVQCPFLPVGDQLLRHNPGFFGLSQGGGNLLVKNKL